MSDTAQDFLAVEDIKEPGFKWTVKRHRFVQAFVQNGGIAKDAAEKAGYSQPETDGPLQLTHRAIQRAIKRLFKKHLDRLSFYEEDVIAKWLNWLDGNAYDYVKEEYLAVLKDEEGREVIKEDGTPVMDPDGPFVLVPKGPRELTKEQKDRVKSLHIVNTNNGQNIKVELYDKEKALDRMAQMLGLLNKEGDANRTPEETALAIREAIAAMDAMDGKPDETKQPVE